MQCLVGSILYKILCFIQIHGLLPLLLLLLLLVVLVLVLVVVYDFATD